MAWYYGIGNYGPEELEQAFPVVITPNLRTTKDRKRLAIINDYPEGTELYDLSDPKNREDFSGRHVFYQTFFGADATAAKSAVEAFLSETEEDGESILLLKKGTYAYGHIYAKQLYMQEILRSLLKNTPCSDSDVFMLPLRLFMHRCPICGHRTLETRNHYNTCVECGWEDEPWMEEDIYDPSSANHGFSMVDYRERYLKKKSENPEYSWERAIGLHELAADE